ncbi:MAG TPA: TetR family transcriptional regulator [Methylomirabilota bacterium]|jgi:AcrR family transcriptional regulator|nr:TetR family transcriptional regulator [Methylomirabilota bacterium]
MATVVPKPPVRVVARDPQRTRERILAAALKEFSAHGFAGGRVDRIARRARVNKRMLYHYFGDKEDLFREILGRKLRERVAWMATAPDDPAEGLAFWLAVACGDRDWVRLLEWEALGAGDGPVILEAERRRAVARAVAKMREQQASGRVVADFDARQLLLTMAALTTFPVAFPQVTRIVMGLGPDHPAFQKQWSAFLRRFARSLKPERAAVATVPRARQSGH